MISKIILTGDVRTSFKDFADIKNDDFEVCANILDVINIAASTPDVIVGIAASSLSDKLLSVIKTIKTHSSAKIILLAQMHEEAIVRQIQASSNGKMLIDDYLICPVSIASFRKRIEELFDGSRAVSLELPSDNIRNGHLEELEKLAVTDDLTGLKNRRYLFEFLRQIIEYAQKNSRQVTLMLFDIDDLKKYNDTYGHLAGDELLKKTARMICRCCRPRDVVGRIGGDEFAAVFWDDPNAAKTGCDAERRLQASSHPREAIAIANRFRQELKKTEMSFLAGEGHGILTISGGLASFPHDGSSAHELLSQADKALLDAKRNGKNRIYLVGSTDSDISKLD